MSYVLGHSLVLSCTDTDIITLLIMETIFSHIEKFIDKIGKLIGLKDLRLNIYVLVLHH